MPQIGIIAAIGAAAATAAAVAAGTVAFTLAATAAFFAKTFVISAVAGYALQELTGEDGIDGFGDATVRGSSRIEQLTVIPKRWILGRSRVRGVVVWFRHLDARLAYVQLLSADSIDAIERVWINGEDVEITRDATTGVITPASGSRFNFTKSVSRTIETYQVVPISPAGDGDGPDREDPDSGGEGPGGGFSTAAAPGGCGGCRGSFGCDSSAGAPGAPGFSAHDGMPVFSNASQSLPMFGNWWSEDIPLKDLLRWNPAMQGTSASAGAAASDGVSGQQEQGEGGGRTTPRQGTVPPGYKRVLVRRTITETVTVPAFKITEYFAADGTDGARIREIAAEGGDGGATQSNDLAWTTEHQLNGISYVLIELEQPPYEETSEGVSNRLFNRIPDIEFLVRGIKIPQIQSGFNTGESRTLLNESPTSIIPAHWTEDAAELRYWWLTRRRKIPLTDIEANFFFAAHAKCRERIRLNRQSGYSDDYPDAVSRYTINGVLNADDRVDAVEKQFDLCWQGSVVEWGGQFLFRPGSQRSVRVTITPDDIIDHPVIRPSLPRENRVNEVNLTLEQSAVEDFQSVELQVADAPAQAKEGGNDGPIRLPTTLPTLAFINQPVQAINFMHQQLRLQRDSMEIDLTVMPGDAPTNPSNLFRFVELLPGDRVELDLPEYGIGQGVAGEPGASSIRYFRVLSNSVNPDMSVNLRLAQWPDRWFFDSFTFPPITPREHIIPQAVPAPVLDGDYYITHHIGQDGKVTWDAEISFVPSPHRIWVSVVSPLTNRQWVEVGPDSTANFVLEDPGTYTFYAYSQRISDSAVSAPLSFSGVASLDITPPAPEVVRFSQVNGNIVKLTLQGGVDRNINGVEARYTFGFLEVNDLASIPDITTDAEWTSALEMNADATFPRTGEPVLVDLTIPEGNGIYKIFIRFHNNIGNNSPIVFVGTFFVNQAQQPTGLFAAHPDWAGTLQNMAVWTHNTTRRLYPSPSNHRALTLDDWSGMNAFPFGAYDGTAIGAPDANRTRYTTRAVDFGRTRRAQVVVSYVGDKPEAFADDTDDPFVITLQHSDTAFTPGTPPTSITLTNGVSGIISARYMRARVRVTSSTKTVLRSLELNWRFLD